MDWSLSKDDDGLEPVGSNPETAPAPPMSSSVVVDPLSQIPQGRQPSLGAAHRGDSAGHPPRRVAEPTLVLKARQIDELRAEVESVRAQHVKQGRAAAVLWAGAGAAALVVGVFLASMFAESEGADEPAASDEAPVPGESAVSSESAVPGESAVSGESAAATSGNEASQAEADASKSGSAKLRQGVSEPATVQAPTEPARPGAEPAAAEAPSSKRLAQQAGTQAASPSKKSESVDDGIPVVSLDDLPAD